MLFLVIPTYSTSVNSQNKKYTYNFVVNLKVHACRRIFNNRMQKYTYKNRQNKKTHTNKKNFFLHVWWGRFISVPVDEAKIDEFARWRWRAVDYFNHVR